MTSFNPSLGALGMLRLGVASPELRVADVAFNLERILAIAHEARGKGCRLLLLPELCLTGYTCGDLFFQPLLVEQARAALERIAEFTAREPLVLVVGAPVLQGDRLFNCAVLIAGGRIRGVVPKTFLPNTQEFYEQRWFAPAGEASADHLNWGGESIPFGADLLFQAERLPQCVVGIEICEDAWVANPPSGQLAVSGATVLLNLSASPELLGKQEYRRALVQAQSARCLAAYAYASAGPGESSTDLVFSGHSLIAEYGMVLAETDRFDFESQLALADVDLQRLGNERLKNNSFAESRPARSCRTLSFPLPDTPAQPLLRPIPAMPFVPPDDRERSGRCREIFALQTTGLAKRLRHTGAKQVVIGISGGLDSTLALLVTAKAFDKLGLARQGICAVTMPGFGTTARTRGNAERLAELLGVSLRVISIDPAVRQHFADIGHDEAVHDITYENSQARERTQILMDIANQVQGLVIGTGDLSELALGWCTYNGDHMSMYGVNSGVPKTLVRYLVSWCAEAEFSGEASAILRDICATPVSPELLPPDENGEIGQVTEDHIGPYLLHDFFLFHVVRLQYPPVKIFHFARQAFAGSYGDEEILHWLKNFYRRFFSQQFKRSCLPDGPKVGSVVLSPRGDWRMPSDASAALWLAQLEELETSR
ncbi:NAD(+) synthase [Desulfuromonas versatilis]|uniref:Glutamine-dependent NAD(+) synthetase n=1 Tax=Desulfuromonas versatilis TaxID=2802975 RepID=A0ABN6DUZ8_9BACT|nr:NAD(+) synthase [Desulfuromonas versatilis]BCR03948.1 NAD(+) synthase [Desulfuromonas versatilis]